MKDRTADNEDILQKLMTGGRATGTHSDADRIHHLTSLGVPLEEASTDHFTIDTTGITLFGGLSTVSRMLVNEFIEQCARGASDIMVQHKLLPQLNPELHEAGVEWIMIYARLEAVEDIPLRHREFNDAIERVFHSIQSARWKALLFPDTNGTPSIALMFPFHLYGKGDFFILAEFERSGKFLRLTVENASLSRLQLKHVPHRTVDNLDRYHLIPDLTQTARQIYQGIQKEALLGKLECKVTLEDHPVLFHAIGTAGLDRLDTIIFHWPFAGVATLTSEGITDGAADTDVFRLTSKELLILQDFDVLQRLHRGAVIELQDGAWRVFFELSRRKSCLHVCWNERRSYAEPDDYLARMPSLKEAAATRAGAVPALHLVLIHHITAEILGLIGACRLVGFSIIDTFFVQYSGVVPDDYMETVLSLPEEQYRFYALQRLETADSVRGGFRLSRHYSSIDTMQSLDEHLAASDLTYMDAMRLAAGHVFLCRAARTYLTNDRMLLIEDGGYVSPLINRFCLEGKTVGETFDHFRCDPVELGLPAELREFALSDWLTPLLVGVVEHTRNGYDANRAVEQDFGRLQFPVCSIAISDLKRGPEAHECAISILNAVENVMHRLGLLLSRRKALVLGSRGAIGSCLLSELAHRLGPGNVAGVDIVLSRGKEGTPVEESRIDDLDDDLLYDTTLIVGTTGTSVMKRALLEDLMILSRHDRFFFASGSTKTLEFTDLENWLVDLQRAAHPAIGGHAVSVTQRPLRDLQTRIVQGQCVQLHFTDEDIPDRTLYLLGNLTPINFLYYGIPREIIDEVLSQLLRVAVGLVGHELTDRSLPRRLLAVDHEIDCDARPSD